MNSPAIAARLNVKCDQGRAHISPLGGRAKRAAPYLAEPGGATREGLCQRLLHERFETLGQQLRQQQPPRLKPSVLHSSSHSGFASFAVSSPAFPRTILHNSNLITQL